MLCPRCARCVASGRVLGVFVLLCPVLRPGYARVASLPVRVCIVFCFRDRLFLDFPIVSTSSIRAPFAPPGFQFFVKEAKDFFTGEQTIDKGQHFFRLTSMSYHRLYHYCGMNFRRM